MEPQDQSSSQNRRPIHAAHEMSEHYHAIMRRMVELEERYLEYRSRLFVGLVFSEAFKAFPNVDPVLRTFGPQLTDKDKDTLHNVLESTMSDRYTVADINSMH